MLKATEFIILWKMSVKKFNVLLRCFIVKLDDSVKVGRKQVVLENTSRSYRMLLKCMTKSYLIFSKIEAYYLRQENGKWFYPGC